MELDYAREFPEGEVMGETEDKATPRPWIVQRLSHVDNELWLQIGWMEGGYGLGPVCEMVGGAVRSTPSFRAVAEFKYLVASDEEVKANANLIVRAVNSYSAFEAMRQALIDVLATGLNGGNNVRLAYIAASQKALSEKSLAKADASEQAVIAARAALALADELESKG